MIVVREVESSCAQSFQPVATIGLDKKGIEQMRFRVNNMDNNSSGTCFCIFGFYSLCVNATQLIHTLCVQSRLLTPVLLVPNIQI